jgi:hypothetical protein
LTDLRCVVCEVHHPLALGSGGGGGERALGLDEPALEPGVRSLAAFFWKGMASLELKGVEAFVLAIQGIDRARLGECQALPAKGLVDRLGLLAA